MQQSIEQIGRRLVHFHHEVEVVEGNLARAGPPPTEGETCRPASRQTTTIPTESRPCVPSALALTFDAVDLQEIIYNKPLALVLLFLFLFLFGGGRRRRRVSPALWDTPVVLSLFSVLAAAGLVQPRIPLVLVISILLALSSAG